LIGCCVKLTFNPLEIVAKEDSFAEIFDLALVLSELSFI